MVRIYCVLLFAFCCLSSFAEEQGRGPVLCYHFDEGWGSSAIDSSGNGNNGELRNGVKRTEGRFGGGLEFNGKSSYLICPDSPSLNLNSAVSMTVWFKPVAGDEPLSIIFCGTCRNRVMTGGNSLQGSYSIGGAYCKAECRGVSPDKWNYAAVTYNGEKVMLYLNGKLVGEVAGRGGKFVFSGPVIIGSENGRAFFFDGVIDEVRIYDYALSQEDIQRQYESVPSEITDVERFAVLENAVAEKLAFFKRKMDRDEKADFADFVGLLKDFEELASAVGRASVSEYNDLKKRYDNLCVREAAAVENQNKKIKDTAAKLKDAKARVQKDIDELKTKGLLWQAPQNDVDMALSYIRLADLKTADVFKKYDYLNKGFSVLEQAAAKINKVRRNAIPDPLKGRKDELLVGVTYSPYEISPAFDTLNALNIKLCGNSSSGMTWDAFFDPAKNKIGDRLKLFDENNVNMMLLLGRPDYKFSGRMEKMGKFQDETVFGKWSNHKGAWLVPAAPSDIPLKWVKEQEKLLKAFVDKYKDSKSIVHWDLWGESHPLSEFYAASPLVADAFRRHLKAKYGSIEKLNNVWNAKYNDFNEISMISDNAWNKAEWKNFRHVILVNYIAYLTNIVKDADPYKRPISPVPDMYQMYPDISALDPYLLAKAGGIYKEGGIDIYAARRDKFPWQMIGGYLDTVRSVTGNNRVWVGEIGHWTNLGMPAHRDCTYSEETREWTYTAFLHGAKAVSHFAWFEGDETAGVGEEGYGFALMHADFTPFETALRIGEIICESANFKELWSCRPERNVAIYYPRLSAMLGKSSSKEMYGLYAIMSDCGFGIDPMDSNFLTEKLDNYKVLVIPPAPYIEKAAQHKILEFVKNGGIVVASSRTLSDEWDEKDSIPELSKIFSETGDAKEYSTVFESINKCGKGAVCIVGEEMGRAYRQDWNIGTIMTNIPIDFDRKENADLRKALRSFLDKEFAVKPASVADKEGIETAVISNGKAKYLMLISHRSDAVKAEVRLNLSVVKTTSYDVLNLKEAVLEQSGNTSKLTADIEAHEVLIYPLD